MDGEAVGALVGDLLRLDELLRRPALGARVGQLPRRAVLHVRDPQVGGARRCAVAEGDLLAVRRPLQVRAHADSWGKDRARRAAACLGDAEFQRAIVVRCERHLPLDGRPHGVVLLEFTRVQGFRFATAVDGRGPDIYVAATLRPKEYVMAVCRHGWRAKGLAVGVVEEVRVRHDDARVAAVPVHHHDVVVFPRVVQAQVRDLLAVGGEDRHYRVQGPVRQLVVHPGGYVDGVDVVGASAAAGHGNTRAIG